MLGYLSYLSGELLGLSGIVTLFCCAVATSHYALHNISAPARVTLVRSCQTLSYVSEGAIFIYVGMDTLDPLKWKVSTLAHSHAASVWQFLARKYGSAHCWDPTAGSLKPRLFCCVSYPLHLLLQSSAVVLPWQMHHPHASALRRMT